MRHDHDHARGDVSRKLILSTAATAAFVVVQLVMGWWSNSLALIGDALHNVTDTAALLLALMAVRLARKPPTTEKSYGYHRAGVLAAFINSATLLALTALIVVEAVNRFREPHPVDVRPMIATAVAGIALNLAVTAAFRRERREDLNIRSAVVHILGDAISSIGIVGAALLIHYTGSPLWDPAISIMIAALILWSSWGILRETVNLLLEGTPSGIDPQAVARSLAAIEGVESVHHLHIWALGPSRPALSCHLMVGDVPVRTTARLLEDVNSLLSREFRIVHTTVQFEFANCAEDDPYCIPWTQEGHGK